MSEHEIASRILDSAVDEILFDWPRRKSVCGRWVINEHFLLNEKALSGISRWLSFDHIVRTDSPRPLQIGELVSRLKRGCTTGVEHLNRPTWLIEIPIDDAFRTSSEFYPNSRPSHLGSGSGGGKI